MPIGIPSSCQGGPHTCLVHSASPAPHLPESVRRPLPEGVPATDTHTPHPTPCPGAPPPVGPARAPAPVTSDSPPFQLWNQPECLLLSQQLGFHSLLSAGLLSKRRDGGRRGEQMALLRSGRLKGQETSHSRLGRGSWLILGRGGCAEQGEASCRARARNQSERHFLTLGSIMGWQVQGGGRNA